ncbi:cobalamin-binding protein [Halobellus sp. Atlit-31R]|nr:cobalamin-binding protein [Halobellus sp. Atlit-31R]
MRVVSLLPSATEILTALGVDPVGISHSCDYPPSVTDRPTVTSTVIDYEGRSSRAIDDQMQSIDGAVYDVRAELLESLDPDLVVTQATCDVCAVDSAAVHDAVERRDVDAEILTLDPHSFSDVLDDLRRVGAAVGREAEAERVRSQADERVDAVRRAVEGRERPRTAVLDWTDPPIRGGHWVRDLIRLAGGDPSFQPDGPSTPLRWARLRDYDPQRLLVAPCGFSTSRAAEAAAELATKPGWAELSAVRSGDVFAVDGNALVNRPGPRLVDSLEAFARCLHPEAVPADGDDWVRPVRLGRAPP